MKNEEEKLHISPSLISNKQMMELMNIGKRQVGNLINPFNAQVMTLELLLVLAWRQGFFDALIATDTVDERELAREQNNASRCTKKAAG